MIPVQFAFLVGKDGTLQIQAVSKLDREIKFKNEKEARNYINNYNEQL